MRYLFAESGGGGMGCLMFFVLLLVIGGPSLYKVWLQNNNPDAWERQERIEMEKKQRRGRAALGFLGMLLRMFLGGK